MSASVKRFRLKKYMSNGEIAEKLGVTYGYKEGDLKGIFSVGDDQWVGSRVNDKIFTLAINETALHKKALEFADEMK